jgi:hypothetical protein
MRFFNRLVEEAFAPLIRLHPAADKVILVGTAKAAKVVIYRPR